MRIALAILVALVARAAAADPVVLRVGTQAIEGSRYMEDMRALGKDIETRTKGEVVLSWVRVDDEREVPAMIARGTLDGAGLSETGLVAIAPEMAAWGAPGVLRTYEQVDRATAALDDDVRALFAGHDLVFAMWADLGFAEVFSPKPIASLGDVLARGAAYLAAPLDGALAAAISAGRAPAWAVPPLYMLAIGGGRAARYMTAIRYRYVVGGLVLSRRAWDRLPRRDLVAAALRDWQPKLRASWRRETDRALAALAKAGTRTVSISVPDEQLASFLVSSSHRAPTALTAKIAAAIDSSR